MPGYLIRKIEHFVGLTASDKQQLQSLVGAPRVVAPRVDFVRQGEVTSDIALILDGWACRYRQLENGRRQVTQFLLPGDLCSPFGSVLTQADSSLATLSSVTLARIPRDQITALAARNPRLMQGLWWEMQVATAIQREWLVNIAQRQGTERLGHLVCELFHRLRAVGQTSGNGCILPVTQEVLGGALGLSSVHVNRTLQVLRARGLLVLNGKSLSIPDLAALQDVSGFSPDYLHLGLSPRVAVSAA